MLLVLRPFRLGDFVETSALKGKVIEVGLFATKLRNTDSLYLLAPNSTLRNTSIVNHSCEPERGQENRCGCWQRRGYQFGIANTAGNYFLRPRVQKNPPPRVVIDDVAGEKVTIKAEYWAETAQ
ncbi:mechanosensitive ion channel domain-containing protein [Rhizobium sp. Root1204]|uniref:mechanosensitive ion channel domain-containing protein n=1 Tax=Rhizobium sp. Root1204 TaxID=1736428 RepID=UPI0026D27CE0